ncbi:MAG: 16S rRNA (cytidine(1402)-2'-O)-methyltransferase [Micavibrio sp.]|nr:16S rRNA (cytidine(1402)-2'-O)-methyltransferase [Micavibrio sp.]
MSGNDTIAKQSKKQPVWSAPEAGSTHFKAGLYLVSTPIGNLRDITLRALDGLAAADIVACEDTRVSGKLLAAYGIKAKLAVYNDHSDEAQRQKLIEAAKDKVVVLISDAGTPLISDPGYKLVRQAQAEGVYISALPGANSPLTALQLSGLPSDHFSFIGFLPSKKEARRQILNGWKNVQGSLVAFETGARLLKALEDIAEVFVEREIAVTRELTKMYEEVRKGRAAELLEHYKNAGSPKGEIVLVIAPPVEADFSDEHVTTLLKKALKSEGTKAAAAIVAEQTGRPKKVLYALALELRDDQ